MFSDLSRRHLLLSGCASLLAGCASTASEHSARGIDPATASIYAARNDPPHVIPALELSQVDPAVLRREVSYEGPHKPGTVVINLSQRRLYFIQAEARAIRFGVGVGREEGLNYRGSATVGRKAIWPSWIPTASMIARIPRYATYAAGMPGGLGNPLGARALYLYRDNQDTFFRIHGTNEPDSIGQAVSSGCIRLFNHDIVYLYDQLAIGTPVIVQYEFTAASRDANFAETKT